VDPELFDVPTEGPTMATIEHCALFAADAKALKDFYVDIMGLKVVLDNGAGTPPGYFLADDSGMALELIGRPAGVVAGDTRYLCHVAFTVADVDAERKRLESLGLTFESETAVDTSAMKTAFFRDPDGNRCQIVWRSRPLGG
jgi:glyoxylase I family protein